MKKFVFSSDVVPAYLDNQARFLLWRDMYYAQFGEGEFTYANDRPFHARCEFAQFGTFAIASMSATLDRGARTPRNIAADAQDYFIVGFNRRNKPFGVEQRGRELVTPTEMSGGCIYTVAEPLESRHNGELEMIGLCVPRAALLQRVPQAEDIGAAMLTSPAAGFLGRYMDFLLTAEGPDADASLNNHVESTLLDLVVLTLGASRDETELASQRGLRAVRRREIVAMIEARYLDPHFSPHDVTRSMGLSQRYVQMLLHESGLSFTERVMELRLQRARTMLADPNQDRFKISEIALACGFGDVSYFNQSFRRKFGVAPSHYRGRGRET